MRGINQSKGSDAELWGFLSSAPDQTVEQIIAGNYDSLWRHCNGHYQHVSWINMNKHFGKPRLPAFFVFTENATEIPAMNAVSKGRRRRWVNMLYPGSACIWTPCLGSICTRSTRGLLWWYWWGEIPEFTPHMEAEVVVHSDQEADWDWETRVHSMVPRRSVWNFK